MLFLKLLPATLGFAVLQVALRMAKEGDLVRRLQARDPRAMADLYHHYGRLTYSVVFRIVGDASVAEALVQEIFLRVWTRVQTFDATRAAIGPWVLTLARNRAIDHMRSADGRRRLEDPTLFPPLESSAWSAERMQRLKTAFEKLSATQRQVIELAYFEGLSQTEIAEKLQQPPGTVQPWMRSALRGLREALAEAASA